MADTFTLAILPGDGIGPEVMAEGLRVLDAVEARLDTVRFDRRECAVGAGEYLRSGDPLPPAAFDTCRSCDAILLGAMGLPGVRWPSGTEMTPQIDLRERLDLYCGLRPIRLYHERDTPLKRYTAGDIDFLIVRENTEGLFSTRTRPHDPDADETSDTLLVTRVGSERLFRAAFAQAQRRRGHVTLIDKANVLPSMAYFRQIFDKVAGEFPEFQTDRVYVDAMSLFLVQRPHTFDVMVTENMFGDILSDLAAGLVGGMGMAPSADIGDNHAVFQPSHGTAPDIAGRSIANPIAMILSVAMMLDWLDHAQTRRGAGLIRDAVEHVLADAGNRTADLAGDKSTSYMGQAVADRIAAT
ncbi:MAG: isocitrate/isopropylmalate dehydrogenase family protein [Phycisphaeraceae bacterium]